MKDNRTIFFSYSRKDSDFALELGKKLREVGANIWLDQLDISPGTNWDNSIQKALENSDTLLVILSKTSVISKNVNDEYSYALEEGKRVVPVLLEDCDIPFRLKRLQYADFSVNPSNGIKTLIETLNLNSNTSIKLARPKAKKKLQISKKLLITVILIIVIAFAVAKLNFFPVNSLDTFQLTVFVHEESGKDQLVLPNRGQIKLIYGDASVIETTNSKGEATFKQIPATFFSNQAQVEILFIDPEGEPYRAVNNDSTYVLKSGKYISLPVKLYGLDKVIGIVKDFETGDPIENARISISGIETFSNAYGEFHLNIPLKQQQKYQTIRAFKEGFELYELSNVPIQTNQEVPIVLKSKQTQ